MALIRWIRRNPLIATGMCFAIGTIPQWVSSVWSLFMSEPLVPWLMKHGIPHLGFSAWWITAPIGVLMFATVIVIEFKVPYLSKKKLRELQERKFRGLTEPTISSPAIRPFPKDKERPIAKTERIEKVGPKEVQGTELQRELSALYKGRTALKVMELIEPYKGRLMEVHGRVSEVNMSSPALYHVILKHTPNVGCICFFKSGWKERLLDLEQDSLVKIRGEFAPNQNGGIIVMRECELISTQP